MARDKAPQSFKTTETREGKWSLWYSHTCNQLAHKALHVTFYLKHSESTCIPTIFRLSTHSFVLKVSNTCKRRKCSNTSSQNRLLFRLISPRLTSVCLCTKAHSETTLISKTSKLKPRSMFLSNYFTILTFFGGIRKRTLLIVWQIRIHYPCISHNWAMPTNSSALIE